MAEAEVAEAYFVQDGEFVEQARNAGEEAQCFLHCKAQNLMYILAFVKDAEDFGLEAGAIAVFAGELDVGEELHFDGDGAVALAGFAASAGDVEGEMAGGEVELLGVRLGGKQLSYQVKGFDVSDWIRTRCAADGVLVDKDYVVEALGSGEVTE